MKSGVDEKLGQMPIKKLILSMSAPIVISMLVQSMYNLVDSIFVAQIGEDALTAVSLAFPLQQLFFAVGIGTATGVNSYISRCLGAQNKKNANKAANNGIVLALLSYLVFFAIGLLFSRDFIMFQTQDPSIISQGPIYLRICCMGSAGIFMHLMVERILMASGSTMLTMVAQMTGAILNIILDPILIFGLFGMPRLGLMGAAVATVTSQTVGAIIVTVFCIKYNKDIKLSPRYMKLDPHIVMNIYKVGLPSIVMISINSLTVFSLNKILANFSNTAVALMGVYYKLQGFIFMPIFGLNNGVVPIVAYSYGAKNQDRLREVIKIAMVYGLAIMLVGMVIMQLMPDKLLIPFKPSQYMIDAGVIAFRIMSMSFLFTGVSIISSGVFQAIGSGFLSMSISIIRQLVVLVPASYLLSLTGNLNNVWWGVFIAELVSFIVCLFVLKRDIFSIDGVKFKQIN
ncbi:Multidrug export protein mepA [Peptostreptococcus anaerobius]|uniref:Probable multidrug resistance protein NorM n=1 Tax=Peptostreptococcus anaerobius TaxID=1261 RepID=A0A379CER2_9FIRM|nr:MATE family efflux transporter [Peptostreptococcus anaerobius]EKX94965.1 MATE efflux family protein [Peptostreptococcus anaerobius VPI 4330 = DSM 2949]SFN36353.1 putative efflux protein, MATE family [Peptostreptococcus anaerobius]SUB60579.1 Multidrug export protein mepA [Peptostreptococcus anaerobius]